MIDVKDCRLLDGKREFLVGDEWVDEKNFKVGDKYKWLREHGKKCFKSPGRPKTKQYLNVNEVKDCRLANDTREFLFNGEWVNDDEFEPNEKYEWLKHYGSKCLKRQKRKINDVQYFVPENFPIEEFEPTLKRTELYQSLPVRKLDITKELKSGEIADCMLEPKRKLVRGETKRAIDPEIKFLVNGDWVSEHELNPLVISSFYKNNPSLKRKCSPKVKKQTYPDKKRTKDLHKIHTNLAFVKAINEFITQGPINVLILDADSLNTTNYLITNVDEKKLGKIYVPNPNVSLAMRITALSYEKHLTIFPGRWTYDFLHLAKVSPGIELPLSAVWLDYTGSWRGDKSKLSTPKKDADLLFGNDILAQTSIFAITVTYSRRFAPSRDDALLELPKIAHEHGYNLIPLCDKDYTYRCDSDNQFNSRYDYSTMSFMIYLCRKEERDVF